MDEERRITNFDPIWEENEGWEKTKLFLKKILAEHNYDQLPPVFLGCAAQEKEKMWNRALKLLADHLEEELRGKQITQLPAFFRAVRVITALIEDQRPKGFETKTKDFEKKIQDSFGDLVERLGDKEAYDRLIYLSEVVKVWPKYQSIFMERTRAQHVFVFPRHGNTTEMRGITIAFLRAQWGAFEPVVSLDGREAKTLGKILDQWEQTAKKQARHDDAEHYGLVLREAMNTITVRERGQEGHPKKVAKAAKSAVEQIDKSLKYIAKRLDKYRAAQQPNLPPEPM